MADIGSLIIKIGADASGLERAFKQLGGSAAQFERGLKTIGTVASTAFFAAAAGAVAMTLAVGKQAEQVEQLSHVTGINTDRLQEYDVALNRAGLTGQDLALVMKQVASSMDQAKQGTGSAADRFRQLGIDIRKVTSTDDLIQKIVQSAGRFADGLQKDAILADLLGKQWQTVIKLFNDSQAIDKTGKALGEILSTRQLAILTQMDDSFDDLMTAVKRAAGQLAVTLAPSIEMIVGVVTKLVVVGSEWIKGWVLGVDILTTKILHLGLKMNELASMPLSSWFSDDAGWKQAVANMRLIGMEEDKQIAKLRALASMKELPAAKDTRALPPEMIDSGKMAQQQQALLDAQLRARQQGFRDVESLARAGLQNDLAIIDERKAAGILSDQEALAAKQSYILNTNKIVEDGLKLELSVYQQFQANKLATFTSDQKGIADRLKFEEESAGKRKQLENGITVAAIEGDTARIQSGLAVRSFWQRQLDDIVASNAFSTGLIISAWTGGVANALVNGGDFVKAAWKQTEIAIVQGGLNLVVQKVAQNALILGNWITTAFSEVAVNEAKNAAIVAGDTATAAASVGIWGGAAAAIGGFFATTLVGFEAMVGTMVATVTAVGAFVMGVLGAIAEALTATVFGIPWAGAIVVGIALIAAALAATGSLGFKEGGIGEFGAGTPAMLHGPEAIIPLNSRGAGFMQDVFGGGSDDRPIQTAVYLDGRQIALATARHLPAALRYRGAPA